MSPEVSFTKPRVTIWLKVSQQVIQEMKEFDLNFPVGCFLPKFKVLSFCASLSIGCISNFDPMFNLYESLMKLETEANYSTNRRFSRQRSDGIKPCSHY